MKRRIIVFSTSWNDEHVGGVLSGIKQKADETNTDVYIFNNYGGFEGDEKFNECEYNIFNLPQIELFDGVLILSNNAHSLNRLNHIIEKIIKNKIPCISIEQDIEELHFVGTDNYKAMYELVEHLIEKHGCKTLNYIGGPTEHPENKERKRAFIDALTNHGIIPEEKRMKDYYFTYDSGIEAYHYFKEYGIEIPDAVVCANDDTALGYADMLTEHGYKVPDDLIITGFDNSSLGREYFPGITSVGRSTIELGQNSLEELLGLIDGKEYPHATYTKHTLCVNGSCGCMSSIDDYAEILRERSHKYRSIMYSRWQVNYFQKNLMICHNMEELKSALYRELFTLKVEEFCILTNENEGFIKGNIEKSTYKAYKNYIPGNISVNNDRDRLLLEIQMYGFYLTDLGLYLDTHSSDKEALRLFNETRDKYYKKVVDFEKMYYPLNSFHSNKNDTYEWLEGKFPWVRGN